MDSMRTSLNKFGIGTSFAKDQNYFVSTVENPPNSGRYESIIKVLGDSLAAPIIVLTCFNPRRATLHHIAITRMAISTERRDWNERNATEFMPCALAEELDKLVQIEPNQLESDYCKSLLKVAGLTPSEKPSISHQIFYILGLIFGANLGYRIGLNIDGLLLGLFFGVIGAILTSSLVGWVAIKFHGYKP